MREIGSCHLPVGCTKCVHWQPFSGLRAGIIPKNILVLVPRTVDKVPVLEPEPPDSRGSILWAEGKTGMIPSSPLLSLPRARWLRLRLLW
jgi:hypothetical protein